MIKPHLPPEIYQHFTDLLSTVSCFDSNELGYGSIWNHLESPGTRIHPFQPPKAMASQKAGAVGQSGLKPKSLLQLSLA